MEKNAFLELLTPEKAREIWFARVGECAPGAEQVPLPLCAGRVVAEPIAARRSSPAFHGAAMDGVAVNAADTFAASMSSPLRLELGRQAFPINTGRPLPPGTNAVVMAENLNYDGNFVILEKAAFPWQHVRKTGEDIVETEIILAPGTRIGPYELGAMAAGGVLKPVVFRKPQVAIIPSGTDLVSLEKATDAELKSGEKLPEFNSLVLSAMLREAGAETTVLPIAPDEPEIILRRVREAWNSGADLIVINAGTSAGSKDFSTEVIEKCGDLLVHGVAMMPGKPVALGVMRKDGRSVPIMGAPGYPVSACMAIEEFVLPLLALWQKRTPPARPAMHVVACNALPSRAGMEERIRVKLGVVGDTAWAVPLPRGAGTVTSLSRADAIISIPANSEGINAGQPVSAQLLRPQAEIEDSLLAIGSHDNALDLVDSFMRRAHPQYHLTSAHVGSLGGLLALARGQAHLAGSHLLDPETGVYNQAAIRRYLKGTPVTLVNLAQRTQGLMVKPGNPANIHSIEDLARGDVRFINRQKGSGTRVLLDYLLGQKGISPQRIPGYQNEEYTHMNVAQAIVSDRADTGLGTMAAANALGLEFIPVGQEEYDLVIPTKYLEEGRMKALLEIIRSLEFRRQMDELGGYDTSRTGEVLWEYDGK